MIPVLSSEKSVRWKIGDWGLGTGEAAGDYYWGWEFGFSIYYVIDISCFDDFALFHE